MKPTQLTLVLNIAVLVVVSAMHLRAENPPTSPRPSALAGVLHPELARADAATLREAAAQANAQLTLHNTLFDHCTSGVWFGSDGILKAEHVTAAVNHLWHPYAAPTSSYLTNCLIQKDQSYSVTATNGVRFYTSNQMAGVFTTVAGGRYYLAASSSNRNVGTTNISAALLAELKTKTTFAPVAFTNATFTTNLVFNVQAQRDTDTPDLGYHYDPIDFVFGGCVSLADLNFNPGTIAAWFPSVTNSENYNWPWGLHVDDTNTATFAGRADARCGWVRANTVQEADGSYPDQ
ncbi:MAG: hypothetical protein RL380_287 [Verrucomicrobiota bacterium]|jgi:hypothetical protein